MVTARRALADTSVFIGLEADRLRAGRFERFEWGISAITLGELRLGVLQAANPDAASRRLSTYQLAQRFEAQLDRRRGYRPWDPGRHPRH